MLYPSSYFNRFCDLLCCMVFISLSMWLKGQITNSDSGKGKETLSASDYTIYVRGLPSDATKQEIVAHFSNLYALDRSDWNFKGYCCCLGIYGKKSRLPDDITDRGSIMYDVDGNQVMVVQTIKHGTTLNVDNTRDDLYIGTWIAECTVIHPNSDLIAEHQKEKLTDIKLKIGRIKMTCDIFL
jgi:RNA recognition motif-containing protein